MTSPMSAAVDPQNRSATRRRAVVTAVAALAPVPVWVLVVPILGHDLLVPPTGGRDQMQIGLPMVVVAALVASLAGWALLAILQRLTSRWTTAWRGAALAALVLSFAPLLFTEGMEGATRVTLALMHLVVAAVLVPALPARHWTPTAGRS